MFDENPKLPKTTQTTHFSGIVCYTENKKSFFVFFPNKQKAKRIVFFENLHCNYHGGWVVWVVLYNNYYL
jgi:hypothetical protein